MTVDVPAVTAAILQRWAAAVLARQVAGCGASYLTVAGQEQPAFCLFSCRAFPVVTGSVQAGERRVRNLLWVVEKEPDVGGLWVCDVEELVADLFQPKSPNLQLRNWFRNVNTPDELLLAEAG